MAERAIFDLGRSNDLRPFLLLASFTHPHDPFAAPRGYWYSTAILTSRRPRTRLRLIRIRAGCATFAPWTPCQ